MGQGEESLTSFFFYICVVYPVTSYFLKPGRFSRTQGLTYAIGFLCLLAAVKTVSASPPTQQCWCQAMYHMVF
jgi:hypothetical protein